MKPGKFLYAKAVCPQAPKPDPFFRWDADVFADAKYAFVAGHFLGDAIAEGFRYALSFHVLCKVKRGK